MPQNDIELEVVSRLIQEGGLRIERQKARIASMERMRDDTSASRIMLTKLEEAQVRLQAQKEEIRKRLAKQLACEGPSGAE
jgi:DNA-binding helix-hairpin-helix protein with protein kinase domain